MKSISQFQIIALPAAVILTGAAVLHWLAHRDGSLKASSVSHEASAERRSGIELRDGLPVTGGRFVRSNTGSVPGSVASPETRQEPAGDTPAAFEFPISRNSTGIALTESIPPAAPGAQLTAGGQSVTVESYSALPGATGPALTVSISPSFTPEASAVAGTQNAGFTYDEQLFRTKWGWAAHEAVRRAAREEAQISE